MRTYHIRTFGCQMNVADSSLVEAILVARGMVRGEDPSTVDLVVVNTCTIRRKAEEKALSELGRFARPRKGKKPMVIAAGCVASQHGAALFGRIPGVDIVVSGARVAGLGELIDRRLAGEAAVVDIGTALARRSVISGHGGTVGAFVTIMHGCDNHCAYCVVPSVRGPETSRESGEILAEIRAAATRGAREVTLLGQNVNSYGRGLERACDFAGLLALVDRDAGVSRVRFTTSHPKDLSPRLMAAMRELPSVCEAIHLPVQAGSDRVLAGMRRGYTAAEYREKVEALRREMPDVAISTDIIVGFPGEDADDFEATIRLIGEVGFAGLFAFKYSPREGTPSALLADDVSPEEKDRRLQAVLELQAGIEERQLRRMEGTRQEVLVEGRGKSGAGLLVGRTRGNRQVVFPGDDDLIGTLATLRITPGGRHALRGERVAECP
jgi:tRNA-2-methylthio-N6-dimethylallyladenosine synthase